MSGVCVNYLQGDEPLEERVETVRKRIGVRDDPWKKVWLFLALLRDKGPAYNAQYQHMLRVALLGAGLAEFIHIDQKVMFYAGILHDVGKLQTPIETLGKKSGWTSQDSKIMESHVMDGYRMLKGSFNLIASVILHHHQFQDNSYPAVLPEPSEYVRGVQVMIPVYGRMLSLCDQYDALHRIDGHQIGIPTGEGIKEHLLTKNSDQAELIERLYAAEVFTTYIDVSSLAFV